MKIQPGDLAMIINMPDALGNNGKFVEVIERFSGNTFSGHPLGVDFTGEIFIVQSTRSAINFRIDGLGLISFLNAPIPAKYLLPIRPQLSYAIDEIISIAGKPNPVLA